MENNEKIYIVLIFLIVAICIFILTILMLKRKNKKNKNLKTSTKKGSLKINEHYCTEIEMKFLEAFHKALPRDFIAFPYVGVDNIVNPKGDKNMFNKILSKYVDVCVFLRRDMTPVLAIDLFNSNPITQSLKKMDSDVYDALKQVGIPIVEIKLVEKYDLNILRKNIIDSLPDNVYVLLKNKIN